MRQTADPFLKTSRIGMFSIACSLGLIPVAVIFGETQFFALVALNFVLFNGTWILNYFQNRPLRFSDAAKGARLPLLVFAVCGNVGWIYLEKTGRLSFAV